LYVPVVREELKLDAFCDLYGNFAHKQVIIFCGSAETAIDLEGSMLLRGFNVEDINKGHFKAGHPVDRFVSKETRALIVSDNQLSYDYLNDFGESEVACVINFDVPKQTELQGSHYYLDGPELREPCFTPSASCPGSTSGSGPCDVCGDGVDCIAQRLGDGIIAICESCSQKYPSPHLFLHRAAYIRENPHGVVLTLITTDEMDALDADDFYDDGFYDALFERDVLSTDHIAAIAAE